MGLSVEKAGNWRVEGRQVGVWNGEHEELVHSSEGKTRRITGCGNSKAMFPNMAAFHIHLWTILIVDSRSNKSGSMH